MPTPNRPGAFNAFEGGSSVYWCPDTGAAQVGGAIRDKWGAIGYENSPLGFPAADELDGTVKGSRLSLFEDGVIEWSAESGAHVSMGGGEVTAIDTGAQELTIAALQETYRYGGEDDLYAVVSASDDSDQGEEITEADFLARLQVGSYVAVARPLDPELPGSFILVEDLQPGATASDAVRQLSMKAAQH